MFHVLRRSKRLAGTAKWALLLGVLSTLVTSAIGSRAFIEGLRGSQIGYIRGSGTERVYCIRTEWLMGTRIALFLEDAGRIAESSGLFGDISQKWRERASKLPWSDPDAGEASYVARVFESTGWMGDYRFHPEAQPDFVLDPELPTWASNSLGMDAGSRALWTLQVTEASGWPMRAFVASMRCAPLSDSPPSYWRVEYVGDFLHLGAVNKWPARQVPNGSGQFTVWYWQQFPMLPWRPLWPGLVVNIAAWSAAWFSLTLAMSAGWRKWRSIRGRCAVCGYPALPDRECSECGRRSSLSSVGR